MVERIVVGLIIVALAAIWTWLGFVTFIVTILCLVLLVFKESEELFELLIAR